MIRIRVLYFASLRERAGLADEELALADGATVADALAALAARRPGLSLQKGGVRWAVGREFADLTAPLSDGAELALLPPVSGG